MTSDINEATLRSPNSDVLASTVGVSSDVMFGLLLCTFATPVAWVALAVTMVFGNGSAVNHNIFIVCAIAGFITLGAFFCLSVCAIYNWSRYRRSLGYMLYSSVIVLIGAAFAIVVVR
jgi:hypothetical protein